MHSLYDDLTGAIDLWMRAPAGRDEGYAHGNAQGMARVIAKMRGTSFYDEWTAALDRYQNWVVNG